MANNSNNPTSAAVAELLPDPTKLPPAVAPGDADDLIASIADQQIDQLIGESDAVKPATSNPASAAAEMALNAADELQQMAEKLSSEARADLVADLNGAATEAMLTPVPEVNEPIAVVPAQAESVPTALPEVESNAPPTTTGEAAPAPLAPAAEAAADASAQPAAEPEPTPEPQAPAALASSGPAMVLAPEDTEINQAEIDALIAGSSSTPTPLPKSGHAAATVESSAEAVARELASDSPITSASVRPTARESAFARLRDFLLGFALTILQWVNLPVRGLSDNAREVIGIIAIVTLVNAMSLLLYLMIFR